MARKLAAGAALTAIMFGAMATPALAKGFEVKGHRPKISEHFEDMKGFEWGLTEVTRLNLSGVFRGRSESLFAPGAKITHQEVAVATVRLIGKEEESKALTKGQVDALLTKVPDQENIADWARPAVAELIKLNAVAYDAPFAPQDDATRLYTAVMLVKAMGLEAEAQSQMNATLPFQDAALIPANQVGYVAVAVSHGLIAGYIEQGAVVFRPFQAVRRVEMAVMMGRADRQMEHKEELKGIVKSVNAAADSLVITVNGKDVTVTLSDDAAVFVNRLVESLAEVTVGMFAEVKLNSQGQAIFVDARTATPDDQNGSIIPPQTVNGNVVAVTAATATTPAKVTVAVSANGQTQVTEYTLDSGSVITINGQPAQLSDLQNGDPVTITIANQKVTLLAVVRPQITTVTGVIAGMTAAAGNTQPQLNVAVTANGVTTSTAYTIPAGTAILVNGQAAQFTDLHLGDAVQLTLTGQTVTKVEVTR